ncbi:primosomal protein N' [uncultured Clostridium sp.]|uniref:primosomal protein N' n=1 Tax=uncultured Clostridium sp. TaxID=59620 RepID=UPI0025F7518A|nr:primosomal protein N' [uncultured Clostridium sp.]MDU4883879.1 primosomal protein N' [Clostridium celatum]MDU7077165.1 primosomal protein N' [Clostridium celatum]
MNLYAEIILNSEALEIDRPFTYKIPVELEEKVQVGQIVKVPFGMGNKTSEGFVLSIKEENEVNISFRVKKISSIVTDEPIINEDDINLINFLREKYLCKYIDAFRLLIPVGIMKGAKSKRKKVIVFKSDDLSCIQKPDGYIDIINFLRENSGKYTKSELINVNSISQYKLNKLIEKELLVVEEETVFRYNNRTYNIDYEKELTFEQKYVLDEYNNSDNKLFLLKGVTGSGKTEVYMRMVEDVLEKNQSAIVLVPEISLTPQMIERFKGRFGRNVALFHSKLSDGERFDEWFRVKEGKAKLVVGARSAIFLPLKNLGLIIIDEEHENTYKSDQNPKYQTKEVAEFLSNQKECRVVLGSATPTIETYYRALTGDLKLLELNSRVDGKAMPPMKIVDMRSELRSGNISLFSRELFRDIQEKLSKGEQIILFLNRRGFSTFVSCRSCGYVFKCEECDISMTYHRSGMLVCHYCGKTKRSPEKCPKCDSKYVKFFGAGTQRVEEEVKKYFKDARVLRMDVDTTRGKDSYENIYNSFKEGKADILIGTQMISKGLDFKKVTLVGVLAADMSINIPDYRAAERTFQIITQVAGRAGRGEKQGKVVIQTYTPEHYSLEYAVNYDYEGFYEKEFTVRALMKYPPFGKILLINGISKKEELLKNFMHKIFNVIKPLAEKELDVDVLGPIPCLVSKVKENYRWQIVMKGEFESEFAKKIKELLYDENKNVYNDIRISMDINPNNLF